MQVDAPNIIANWWTAISRLAISDGDTSLIYIATTYTELPVAAPQMNLPRPKTHGIVYTHEINVPIIPTKLVKTIVNRLPLIFHNL